MRADTYLRRMAKKKVLLNTIRSGTITGTTPQTMPCDAIDSRNFFVFNKPVGWCAKMTYGNAWGPSKRLAKASVCRTQHQIVKCNSIKTLSCNPHACKIKVHNTVCSVRTQHCGRPRSHKLVEKTCMTWNLQDAWLRLVRCGGCQLECLHPLPQSACMCEKHSDYLAIK
eukprot:1649772-Amphidinium_carterae.6